MIENKPLSAFSVTEIAKNAFQTLCTRMSCEVIAS